MASKTRTSAKDRAQQAGLTSLPFEPPKPRYESKATYRNDRGQEFRIWVNGFSKATVQQYTKAVRVRLEIVSDDGTRLPSTDPSSTSQEQVTKDQHDELSQQQIAVDQQVSEDREITIGVITTAGIQPPYLLQLHIDPPTLPSQEVGRPGQDIYVFLDTATSAHVDIHAIRNEIQAQFGKMHLRRFEGSGGAITVSAPKTKPLDGETTNLALSIRGLSSTISEYNITGFVRLSDG